ncbi:dnl zinc finger domain containing [Fusarium longipes]|uniref:Dnl zinc finger domain containing n=1 Tax=Fusarium longipes TaxID=694270 RepID=A0A395RPG3_9HYPO|nr:dnl zinc finger domain containing [Fusarium longipes]
MVSRSSLAPAVLRQLCAQPQRLSSFLHAPLARPVANLYLNRQSFRAAHNIPRPPPRTIPKPNPEDTQVGEAPKSEGERPEIKPSHYQLSFTCIPCGHRSHHNVSKQGYHFGSTLITCPECRNRHVISDHLKIFGDKSVTLEQLMKKKGRLVKRGTLGEDGDIEFWPEKSLPGSKSNKENSSD